tara:strand:+ start:19459 stop:19668 length:210 start_codon:yes stop_codon:yes gene_type:complete
MIFKKLITKYLRKKGYRKYSIAELKTMNIGIILTQEYIQSRKLRRILKETEVGSFIKETISEWEKIPED